MPELWNGLRAQIYLRDPWNDYMGDDISSIFHLLRHFFLGMMRKHCVGFLRVVSADVRWQQF